MLAGKIYNVSSSSSSSSAVEQFAQLMWIASIMLFGTLGWWQQQTVVVSAAAATNISAGDKISATEMGGKRHQFCCYVRDIFTFNPFNTLRMQRGRIRFAALRLSDGGDNVDNDEALEQQRQRQSMSKFLKINLQGNTVNVTFFPAIMAYLKDDSDYYKNKRRKQSGVSKSSSTEEKQFDSYFGTDIEMLKELAHRMNFTARMIIPGDGQYYGFRVRR